MHFLFLLIFCLFTATQNTNCRAVRKDQEIEFLSVAPQVKTNPKSAESSTTETTTLESSPSKKKGLFSRLMPSFLVKIIKPKQSTRRSQPDTLPTVRPNLNDEREPFAPKNPEKTKKIITSKRDGFRLPIRRTELSDEELYKAFKSGKFSTSGSETGITTSEYLYCEDHVIVIQQIKGENAEIFDVSDEFEFKPDADKDLYNLVVFRTNDTDDEILQGCKYGEHFVGKIFLRDHQFFTITVDSDGYCAVTPTPTKDIFDKGYTVEFRDMPSFHDAKICNIHPDIP